MSKAEKRALEKKKQQKKKVTLAVCITAGVLIVAAVIAAVAVNVGRAKKEAELKLTAAKEAAEKAAAEETIKKDSIEKTDPLPGIIAVIDIEDYGTIRVELDEEAAPVSVANFVKLAESGFYDGLTFHRIIEGFMMQGGDPTGTGMGGSEETIVGEFALNGYDNPISHTRGTISMARSGDPNSASSQFFIVHQDSPFLDGQYAGFGHVIEGIEVVDAVCENAEPIDSNGTIPPEAQPVIKSVTIESK